VIKWAEAGTYNNIPSSYFLEFPDLIDELNEYQQFRKDKRLNEFPDFQGCVVTNLASFMREVGMLPNTFAMKACVPHSEVFRALTQGKISTTIREFFLTIGAEFVGDN
jgi:hypothetical protein